jgi:hypothetical protein
MHKVYITARLFQQLYYCTRYNVFIKYIIVLHALAALEHTVKLTCMYL